MSAIEMQSHVILKCIKERSKLRVKIVTKGYNGDANCQFPRDCRKEGCMYKVKTSNIRLITTRGKYYYSVARSAVEILQGGCEEADGQEGTAVTTENITVFEDERTTDCCICMCESKQIVFNCGHLYTCKACSVLVNTCPICRQRITQRIDKSLFG
mmetsp:Transcript_64165/g.126268  ORF Transcript_64165/g.126268 Transcript_64165/m.126268 type:complete len:156 (-) Transcript_64165:131-598(-)